MNKLLWRVFFYTFFLLVFTINVSESQSHQSCATELENVKYIENKGQWDVNVLYKANIPAGMIFLENNSLTYSFLDFETINNLHDLGHERGEFLDSNINIEGAAFKVEFLESNKDNIVSGEE